VRLQVRASFESLDAMGATMRAVLTMNFLHMIITVRLVIKLPVASCAVVHFDAIPELHSAASNRLKLSLSLHCSCCRCCGGVSCSRRVLLLLLLLLLVLLRRSCRFDSPSSSCSSSRCRVLRQLSSTLCFLPHFNCISRPRSNLAWLHAFTACILHGSV